MYNRLIENNYKSASPEIGMGATLLMFSDRHAYTIIAVSKSGKTITIQADAATRTDNNGMSEMQSYAYERNPNGAIHKIRFSQKRAQWQVIGGSYHPVVMLGRREEYHDYSF